MENRQRTSYLPLEAMDQRMREEMHRCARYAHGDDFTERHYQLMRSRMRRTDAVEFAAALEDRMGGTVRCVPGLNLEVSEPTTIGLGDTFVGGVLAAVAQKKAARWT